MKYPDNQMKVLIESLTVLNEFIDIETVNPSSLHFLVYQQHSEGQQHNAFYVKDNKLVRRFKLNDLSGYKRLLPLNTSFELYPNDCVDNNIETGIRKAIKQIHQ